MTADGRAGVTAELVARLVAGQFPAWADLPVRPVEADGWDNRTYRLGEELSVRLPTRERYVAGVAKEDRWLPVLAPRLPLPVPVPVATGRPAAGYPHPWSVRRWIPGRPLTSAGVADPTGLGLAVAGFLRALRAVPATGGPAAGTHSFLRGCPPAGYAAEVRTALDELGTEVDRRGAEEVWRRALASSRQQPAVWFHGDVAAGNLLLDDTGRLAAVIDFGTCGVGDPACDLVLAWTALAGDARAAFREAVGLDEPCWRRAAGWALWKALVVLAGRSGTAAEDAAQHTVIREVSTELG